MKHFITFILVAVLAALLLTGCSYTRETVRHRDDFFRPVTVLPQRIRPTLSSKEMGQLKTQLESATQVATTLRDSLASLQQYAGSLLTTTRALVDKVSELEAKEYLTMNRQSDLEKSIAQLQIENKLLSQQLADLRRRLSPAQWDNLQYLYRHQYLQIFVFNTMKHYHSSVRSSMKKR